MKTKLSSKISIPNRQAPETPFTVTFELVNKEDSDIFVLKHDTPLEGLFSDCFEVTRDGVPVPYDGPLVKRAAPAKDDYLRIRPGEKVTAEVDLSSCYQVSVPGNYEVSFRGVLPSVEVQTDFRAKLRSNDLSPSPKTISCRPAKFKVSPGIHGRATAGEAARRKEEEMALSQAKLGKKKGKLAKAQPPTTVGGSEDQKTNAEKAHRDGYDLTVAAIASLKNDAAYLDWFGTHSAARFKKVKDTYTTVRDIMDAKTFTYNLTGTGCKPGWFAYTYKGTTTIWLCGGFWNAPENGTDSKAGTVLHEHTHASASTDDLKYGQAACRQLAKDDPDSAIKNADSFEYSAGG